MFTGFNVVRPVVGIIIVWSTLLGGQEKPAAPSAPLLVEFPVTMKQKVEAGKTPVGTKVQAELVIPTLVNGKTVPRDAVLSGVVTESVAKTATDPSRLGIRMDSIQWKKGSETIKAYLTAWFYPIRSGPGPDLAQGPTEDPVKTWNGMGAYPSSAGLQRFPDTSAIDPERSPSDTPATAISKHRVPMKDVNSFRNDDGSIAITSKRSNLKLDKFTTYVIATGNLLSRN